MVDTKAVIDANGDFKGAHEIYEAIKKADPKDLAEPKPPGTIIFIGDNCTTKERIYKTVFGDSATSKASVADVTSSGSAVMTCSLYSTEIKMAASVFASKEAKTDYQNAVDLLDNPAAMVVCGLKGLDEYSKVAKRANLKFLAVSEDDGDKDEIMELAETHGM